MSRPQCAPTKIFFNPSAIKNNRKGAKRLVIKAAEMSLKPNVLSVISNSPPRKTVRPGTIATEAKSFNRNRARNIPREGDG